VGRPSAESSALSSATFKLLGVVGGIAVCFASSNWLHIAKRSLAISSTACVVV
jgi:hypothetical protein